MRRQLQRPLLHLYTSIEHNAISKAASDVLPRTLVSRSLSMIPHSPEAASLCTPTLQSAAVSQYKQLTSLSNFRSFASSAKPDLEPEPAPPSTTTKNTDAASLDLDFKKKQPSVWPPTTPSTSSSHRDSLYQSAKIIADQQNKAKSQQQRHVLDSKLQHSFKAEAVYVGSRINIQSLMRRPEFENKYKRLHKGSMIVALSDRHIPDLCESEGMPLEPFLVAFDYGSVVFFNTNRDVKDHCLSLLRSEASDPTPSDRPYTEDVSVSISPGLDSWSQQDSECIKLKVLDLRNMQVISQVLAQSVAMDFYSSHVERTLETFCSMNLDMLDNANLAKINKQHLLQLVAENNIVMTEIISKLGVHERYDIAWKHVQYGRIWEFLRVELEMDARFKTLDMKMNLIQDNLKYFLELLQAQKSDSLEWTIIILIGAEICLSLYELATKSGVA